MDFFHRILSSTREKEEQDRISEPYARSPTDTAQGMFSYLETQNKIQTQIMTTLQTTI